MENLSYNLIIANILGVTSFALNLYAASNINRKKYIIWVSVVSLIDAVSYFLLNAYIAFVSCVYWAVKNIVIVKIHKEEKIIQSKIEAVLFAFPFLIFGFLLYKIEGSIAISGALLNFLNTLIFITRKDRTRIIADATMDMGYLVYDIYVLNIVGAVKFSIEIAIHIINLVRLHKNGERKYYKDQTNVGEQ